MDCPKAWGGRLRWSSHSLLTALLLLAISGVAVHGAYDSCSASTPFSETSTATLVPNVFKLNEVPPKGSIKAPVLTETDGPERSSGRSARRAAATGCPINTGALKKETTGVLLRASRQTNSSKPIKGVNEADGGGYQPPDQALCVGKHYIVEGGNVVWAIYNKAGKLLLKFNKLSFFGLPNNGDPVCFFDTELETFFLASISTFTTIAVATFKDGCHLSSPVHVYTIPYDGLPDYPQIGSDKYGFWVATNQFEILSDGSIGDFVGVDVVGIDKAALAKGLPAFQYHISRVTFDEDGVQGYLLFTLHPQRLQPGSSADCTNNGVMYFIANNDEFDSEIAIAAVTNTKNLVKGVKPSGLYILPLPAGTVTSGNYPGIDQPDGNIITSFDARMQSAAYAAGKLYGTSMSVGAGSGISISYFVVKPSFCKGALTAKVLYSDTIGDDCGNHMVFPSIGVNPSGNAIIAFSYTGRTAFPSVGYVPLTADGIVGPNFYLAVKGTDNADLFRWGDYSASQYDPCTKQVYFATLTAKDEWTTWISSATPPCAPYTKYLPPPLSTYPPCPTKASP